jgi:hypothetical protein
MTGHRLEEPREQTIPWFVQSQCDCDNNDGSDNNHHESSGAHSGSLQSRG